MLRIRTLCLGTESEDDDCDTGYLVRLEWQSGSAGSYQDQVSFNYTGTIPIDWDVRLTKAGWQISWEGVVGYTYEPATFASTSLNFDEVWVHYQDRVAVAEIVRKDYVDFSQDLQQALVGEPLSLKLQSAGGITIVTRVVFKGCSGCDRSGERVIDFGDGPAQGNVYLSRLGNTTMLRFVIWNGGDVVCSAATDEGVIEEDTWMTLVARFNAVENSVDILKDGQQVVSAVQCSSAPIDRNLSAPFVGKGHWEDIATSHIGLAGLVVVEGYLSDDIALAASNQLHEGSIDDGFPQFDLTASSAEYVLYAAPSFALAPSPQDTCVRPSFCRFPFTYQGHGHGQCTMQDHAGIFW